MLHPFKDNFSHQSESYARYRPGYPTELFEYLSSIAENNDLAWDCGTGNGQAAISLVNYFKKVVATDPSAEQVKNAMPHERIEYKIEKAEHTSLPDHSVDLITIAQALHWFDFSAFYSEAKRVLKKKGIIAAWAYQLPMVNESIDKIISHLHFDVLGDYWLPENKLILEDYATIPFPFQEMDAPVFKIQKQLSLQELLGHLNSWSAVQRYIRENGIDPVSTIHRELSSEWGTEENKKEVTWRMIMKVGKNKY